MLKTIKITQIKSSIGCKPKHKATLRGLGLSHIGDTVKRTDTPEIRGMIKLVYYMIKMEK
ncbi:50S ribosomal protein L30 [Candidatus Blochmannia ocreatus (nom. nud.)]|uniref:Large ribosomal subunit protein uL30 n=1 Tax=Candidatus Blochmannia ocreatus (nom. nud.) TaxID=251538 RepID=A0ABY4STS8_9ENTR|nr:50S ribosomal protein L30 [Candidatus Blochmannia ocreatus]URJ25286.1 50S ribosomal protein L30 [Candidatus Blochmannia ocreatus]